jgi:hypothetical protein
MKIIQHIELIYRKKKTDGILSSLSNYIHSYLPLKKNVFPYNIDLCSPPPPHNEGEAFFLQEVV